MSFKYKPKNPALEALKAEKRIGMAEIKRARSSFTRPRKRINSRRKQYKGIKFDSTWEYECYLVLERRLQAGEIENLETHVLLPINIKNEAGLNLRLTLNIDFTFYDKVLQRHVRADSKPPKKLDSQKKSWFLRWQILQHLEPDFLYQIYRMHSTWRTIDI